MDEKYYIDDYKLTTRAKLESELFKRAIDDEDTFPNTNATRLAKRILRGFDVESDFQAETLEQAIRKIVDTAAICVCIYEESLFIPFEMAMYAISKRMADAFCDQNHIDRLDTTSEIPDGSEEYATQIDRIRKFAPSDVESYKSPREEFLKPFADFAGYLQENPWERQDQPRISTRPKQKRSYARRKGERCKKVIDKIIKRLKKGKEREDLQSVLWKMPSGRLVATWAECEYRTIWGTETSPSNLQSLVKVAFEFVAVFRVDDAIHFLEGMKEHMEADGKLTETGWIALKGTKKYRLSS